MASSRIDNNHATAASHASFQNIPTNNQAAQQLATTDNNQSDKIRAWFESPSTVQKYKDWSNDDFDKLKNSLVLTEGQVDSKFTVLDCFTPINMGFITEFNKLLETKPWEDNGGSGVFVVFAAAANYTNITYTKASKEDVSPNYNIIEETLLEISKASTMVLRYYSENGDPLVRNDYKSEELMQLVYNLANGDKEYSEITQFIANPNNKIHLYVTRILNICINSFTKETINRYGSSISREQLENDSSVPKGMINHILGEVTK